MSTGFINNLKVHYHYNLF